MVRGKNDSMFLTKAVVVEAVKALMTEIQAKLKEQNAGGIHISLVSPGQTIWGSEWEDLFYDETILRAPENTPWPGETRATRYARGKAALAARTQTTVFQTVGNPSQNAHLLEEGDVDLPGGVYHRGMAAGISGLKSANEAMAFKLIDKIAEICNAKLAAWRVDHPNLHVLGH